MKIKLVVVNKNLGQPLRFEPHYFRDPRAAQAVDLLHTAEPQCRFEIGILILASDFITFGFCHLATARRGVYNMR